MATSSKPGRPAKVEVTMIRVRAIERGYDNATIREPGDEFEMPATMEKKSYDKDGKLLGVETVPHTAPWFERIED